MTTETEEKPEIRALSMPVEVRADDDSDKITVEGYAAVFDEEADIYGMFRETFIRGAFANAIKEDDVVFLINHDDLPLARSTGGKGTLQLKEDKKGLHIRAELDGSDPDVLRIVPKMKRGDLSKMSIAFRPTRQEWIDPDGDGDEIPLRKIMEARLFDVSIVTNPAYEGTEIGLRALRDYRTESGVPAHVRKVRMKIKQGLAARSAT